MKMLSFDRRAITRIATAVSAALLSGAFLFSLAGCDKPELHHGVVCGKRFVAEHQEQRTSYAGKNMVHYDVEMPDAYYLSVADGNTCDPSQDEIKVTEKEYAAAEIAITRMTYVR